MTPMNGSRPESVVVGEMYPVSHPILASFYSIVASTARNRPTRLDLVYAGQAQETLEHMVPYSGELTRFVSRVLLHLG